MLKNYKNKELKEENIKNKKQSFFFPKGNPPVTIEAESIEEATEQLQIINKKNHE